MNKLEWPLSVLGPPQIKVAESGYCVLSVGIVRQYGIVDLRSLPDSDKLVCDVHGVRIRDGCLRKQERETACGMWKVSPHPHVRFTINGTGWNVFHVVVCCCRYVFYGIEKIID